MLVTLTLKSLWNSVIGSPYQVVASHLEIKLRLTYSVFQLIVGIAIE